MHIKRFSADMEYKRDKKLSKEVVLQILDWMKNQPHLPEVQEEDVILFLSSCNYSPEVAKQTIECYYTYRTHFPELFSNRDPLHNNSELLSLTSGYYFHLSGLTDEGYKVLYCGSKDNEDTSNYSIMREIKTIVLALDNMLYEEGAQQGVIIIYDMYGATAGDLTQLSPTIVKKMLNYFMDASPVHVKGLHLIRPTAFVDFFLNLLMPFLSKSTKDLLKVHTTLEDLYKIVPKRLLPSEIGGNTQSKKEIFDIWAKNIVENRNYFIEEEKLRVDESKRPIRPKTASDVFGIEGSFRKLDLD